MIRGQLVGFWRQSELEGLNRRKGVGGAARRLIGGQIDAER